MKTFALALVIILGILFPYGHPYTFLVRYSVMIMLFFAFMEMKVERSMFRISHFWIIMAIMGISLSAFGLGSWLTNSTVSLAVLLIAMAPTAAAAPVITSFLKADVAYVTFSVLLTSLVLSILIPLVLPTLGNLDGGISVIQVLVPVLITVGLPMLLAQSIRKVSPATASFLVKYKAITYWMFVGNVYIAISKASYFVRYETEADLAIIAYIGVGSLLVCLTSFGLGYFLEKDPSSRKAASMSLGRKNTMFSIWLSLTFISPLVALGPMFYIVWQNTINGIQLSLVKENPQSNETTPA
ncbi:MAG: hypothetical protein AAF388_19720 [Bacteroidota bacterium]